MPNSSPSSSILLLLLTLLLTICAATISQNPTLVHTSNLTQDVDHPTNIPDDFHVEFSYSRGLIRPDLIYLLCGCTIVFQSQYDFTSASDGYIGQNVEGLEIRILPLETSRQEFRTADLIWATQYLAEVIFINRQYRAVQGIIKAKGEAIGTISIVKVETRDKETSSSDTNAFSHPPITLPIPHLSPNIPIAEEYIDIPHSPTILSVNLLLTVVRTLAITCQTHFLDPFPSANLGYPDLGTKVTVATYEGRDSIIRGDMSLALQNVLMQLGEGEMRYVEKRILFYYARSRRRDNAILEIRKVLSGGEG